jgi:penicillin-binding protein 1C
LTYNLRLDRLARERIPLEATTDSDVRQLYWFVNDRFVSAVKRDEIAFWRPVPGKYEILAVDDLGRSHAQNVTVRTVR